MRWSRRGGLPLLVGLLVVGCRHAAYDLFTPRPPRDQAALDAAPLGSVGNPVRCEQPDGERAYLRRLRCPSGAAPVFHRQGSFGAGPYGTILDAYEVRCPESSEPSVVYLDMYHVGFVESRPVPGFSIEDLT